MSRVPPLAIACLFCAKKQMTHHQPAHGKQNTEEGFQRPQAVLSATLSLKSSHTHPQVLSLWRSITIEIALEIFAQDQI